MQELVMLVYSGREGSYRSVLPEQTNRCAVRVL